MNYQEKINQIAFSLFREWTKNAKNDFPEIDFTIIDERRLSTDLSETINSSVEALLREEKAEKRKKNGYDYGFIIDYIGSNLNQFWYHEYISKTKQEYKDFMVNKALFLYLKSNETVALKLMRLYEKLLKNDLNLENLTIQLDETDNKFELNKELPLNFTEKNNPVIISLKNRINQQILEIVDIETKNYLPELEPFFEENMVSEIIINYSLKS